MTLLGKLVETSCHQERSQTCKRRQRTLWPRRESELGALQHLTDAHQVDGRRDGLRLQLRLWLAAIACSAQPMAAHPFGKRAFDACPQSIALLKGMGGLFGTAARARLMNGLRRKG